MQGPCENIEERHVCHRVLLYALRSHMLLSAEWADLLGEVGIYTVVESSNEVCLEFGLRNLQWAGR